MFRLPTGPKPFPLSNPHSDSFNNYFRVVGFNPEICRSALKGQGPLTPEGELRDSYKKL